MSVIFPEGVDVLIAVSALVKSLPKPPVSPDPGALPSPPMFHPVCVAAVLRAQRKAQKWVKNTHALCIFHNDFFVFRYALLI